MQTGMPDTDPFAGSDDDEGGGRIGRPASQRHVCLVEVWKAPGRTAAEIAVAAGLKRHVPSRRLPELRSAGQVRNGPERICTVTGNRQLTWLPNVERNG